MTAKAEIDIAPSASQARSAGRRVLEIEARALLDCAEGLDGRFDAAIDLLAENQGRVIVTGMGKSGHVARKIAATLASTGTPAFFVHPGEASHGDLGMIARDDLLIALSNSGGTAELADMLAYAKRFRVPVVGMTAKAESALAEASDVLLLLPAAPEACPMGLAPTTSTTMMLALGDALAVALLERRGFSADDFRIFHPGGSLGRRLLKVAEIMHGGDAIPLATADRAMSEVLIVMTAKSFGCVGIVDADGRLAGIITDGDLRRHMAGDLLARRAEDVMTPAPRTIRPTAMVEEALAVMNLDDRPVTSLFVVDGERRPIGVIHVHDVLRAGVT
ncbi:KpsF/GutQ family sugar-phosphate isomerase [Inquilinus sp. CAU 1745]|uniref:KpsF/GutQ family sugar-phosphate isomerase n=1 Tax=Inquilinus sp. CAU 1745 TaxID=3140369 RepID=UPI00325A8BE6